MKAFWFCGRFHSEASWSFSRLCPSILQKSQFTYQIFSIVWLPRVNCQLLLCKAKPAWIIKKTIHYVTLQHVQWGSYSKKFLPTLNVTFDTNRSRILKRWHCLEDNGSGIQNAFMAKSLILVSFCWKKNKSTPLMHSLTCILPSHEFFV